MSEGTLRLKHPSGFFAAGNEVRDAMALLSDGGFKVFIYVCLHADRRTAQLRFRMAELAKAVDHSTRSLTSYLDELHRTEVGAVYRASNQHELGRIEIRDHFWPYQKESGDSTEDPEQAQYVARVRDRFLEQACVTSAFGAADQKLASDWYRAGVSIDVVGIMELETTFQGCRFAIGIRNAHDKSMRLAMTVGYRVMVCENMAFSGDFTPVLAKHSKNFNLIHSLEIGVSDMQRNFVPMTEQVKRWRESQLTDVTARLVIYQAFIEAELDIPKHLAVPVHKLYFNPEHEEFAPRTMWSLSNAFTSALKQLDPIPQYRATAKLASFLEARLVR
jgi:hypothetical protein